MQRKILFQSFLYDTLISMNHRYMLKSVLLLFFISFRELDKLLIIVPFYHARETFVLGCNCDLLGTNSSVCTGDECTCDKRSGQCPCLAIAIGRICGECTPGHWRAGLTEGCVDCECSETGSQNGTTCNQVMCSITINRNDIFRKKASGHGVARTVVPVYYAHPLIKLLEIVRNRSIYFCNKKPL